MSYTAEFPIGYIPNPDKFGALAGGDVYFGVPNGSPATVPGDQIQVYAARQGLSDLAIAQPVDIGPGGEWWYSGQPVQIKVLVPYCVQVMNSLGVQKYYAPAAGDEIAKFIEIENEMATATIQTVATFADLFTTAATIGRQVSVVGHGLFDVVSSSGLANDGWSIFINGSIAFVRVGQFVSLFEFMSDAQRDDVSNNLGVVDVTAPIQAAIDSGKQISWPEGTYRFTSLGFGIFQRHQAIGSVTLVTSIASGNAITVSNEYGYQPPLLANGLYRQEVLSGPFQIYCDNAASTATGIYFGDTPPGTTYSAPNLHFNGVVVNKFLVSHAFGNNAYIIQFENCDFFSRSVGLASSRGIYVDQVVTNSGGLINYDNCVLQGFADAIYINLGGLELTFNKCSFDVNTAILANVANDSVLRFSDCRYEWSGDTTQFNVLGNSVGCSVFIDTPYVQLNGTGAAPANPTFAAIGNAGYMTIRSGVWRDAGIAPPAWCSINGAGTLIYDSEYKALGVGATVFANKVGAGIASGVLNKWLSSGDIDIPDTPFPGSPTMSFRFGDISVASPTIAANAATDITVTWSTPIDVIYASAQVYPSASTDFYGVISSAPLTSTSHKFTVRNGSTAQGVNGQFLIVGYE